jgi:hypothetical protein
MVKVSEPPSLVRPATGASPIVYVVFAPNAYEAAVRMGPGVVTVTPFVCDGGATT